MSLARIPLDIAVAAALYPAALWVLPEFGRWTGRISARPPARALTAGLCLTDGVIWILNDLAVISPWHCLLLTIAAALAYGIASQDDDHRGPGRRVRAALKRAKRYLAHGVPARQPVGAR